MKDTVKYSVNRAIEAVERWEIDLPREKWCMEPVFCAQAMIIAAQVSWTNETEAALEELENGAEDAVQRFLTLCNERLESLILLVQGDLTPLVRTKVTTLITSDVHCRDMVNHLISHKVQSVLDFNWRSQFKYYYNADRKEVTATINDFTRVHGYEYIGNIGRLVITSLTDKCFLTLTTALSLFVGGAPAGPAGTGKTESKKCFSFQ
jgi:dynein heavy chain, axonemal